MLSKKKKIFIICSFAVLLVATGVLNVVLNKTFSAKADKNAGTTTVANFFETYRTDRKDTRDQEVLYYDAIVTSASSSAEAISQAEAKRQSLVEQMEMELVLEGLIKAKGFTDVVVSTTASSINVIVKSEALTSDEVAQIVDIIQGQTAYTLDNIKIIPVA